MVNKEVNKERVNELISKIEEAISRMKEDMAENDALKGNISTLNLQTDNVTKQSPTKKSLSKRQFEV